MGYTINVSLPKNLAELAKKKVKGGYYASLSELIREALRDKVLYHGDIPAFPMSKKREKIALEAVKEYKEGKTTVVKDAENLAEL